MVRFFVLFFYIYWFLLAMWCQRTVRPKEPQGMNDFRIGKWCPLWSTSVSKLYFWQKNATMIKKTFLKKENSIYKYKKYQKIWGLVCFFLFCIQVAFSFPIFFFFFFFFELPFAKPFGCFWCVVWFFLFRIHIQLASFLIFHFFILAYTLASISSATPACTCLTTTDSWTRQEGSKARGLP